MIFTGNPGTGKTTIIKGILKIFKNQKLKCLLMAPTGRAAKRLSETRGMEAKTIHRALEMNPTDGDGIFHRNENNPLDADVVIIAGCGIHNSGCNEARHDGVHTFHVGKGANVRYEEKHYGEGEGTGAKVLNPVTKIYQNINFFISCIKYTIFSQTFQPFPRNILKIIT